MTTRNGCQNLSDEELLSRFEHGRLEPGDFHHGDHVRLAWICLRRFGRVGAEERLLRGIRAMAERAGAPQKFLYTTTVAWVRLVAAAMSADEAPIPSFATWVNDHPQLLDKNGLSKFYSRAVLESPKARRGWVDPDLAPLPSQN